MATRAKYTRVPPKDERIDDKLDTDIMLRNSQGYGKYVSRALTLFFGENKTFVTIKAADRIVDRVLWVAELLKRKVKGLHQITSVSERKIVDVYIPREEGLVQVERERYLTILEVVLTLNPTAEQKKAPGYQPPLEDPTTVYLTKEEWATQQEARNKRREENTEEGNRKPSEERDVERKRGRN